MSPCRFVPHEPPDDEVVGDGQLVAILGSGRGEEPDGRVKVFGAKVTL